MQTIYFYKIENNIEYVWRVRQITNDPYRENQTIAEHFVGNIKQFIGRILRSENDLRQYNFLANYKTVGSDKFNEEKVIHDEIIGLLRQDESELYACRHILGLNKIALVRFENSVDIKSARQLFQKAVNIDKAFGMQIIQAGFEYYKKLWSIDEYFSEPNLNTIEKFEPTIELQSVTLYGDMEEEFATYYFRPSWDEEHGMYVRVNFRSMTCKVED